MFGAIAFLVAGWLGFFVGSLDAQNVVTARHIELAVYTCRDKGGLSEIKNGSVSEYAKGASVTYGTAVCKDKTEHSWAKVWS